MCYSILTTVLLDTTAQQLLVDELRRPPRIHVLELLPLGGEDDQLRAAQCILEAGGVIESGETLRALSMPCGSYRRTLASASESWPATVSAGESRTSSEFGLNVAPSTVMLRPMTLPSSSRARSTTRWRRRILIASTSRRNVSA